MSDTPTYVKLKQTAVYWALSGFDKNAKPTYSDPVEIKCRWEDLSELFVDVEGRESVSKARVFADRDLAPKGVLWLGLLANIGSPSSNPFVNTGAWEIRRWDKTPNLKATKFERHATL